MKPPRTFITAHEVADLLEFHSAEQFLTRRLALEREHGFPTPVVFCKRPMKWRRDDVVRWLEGSYQPPDVAGAAPFTGDPARRVVMLQEARRA